MVAVQLAGRGERPITDPRALEAMRRVPREAFVPECDRRDAYGDHPLPIGHGQTISQPYIVALMTQSLAPRPGERILEVGSGCGYQSAVLAEMGAQVFAAEFMGDLAEQAREKLDALGYGGRVRIRSGDGRAAWLDEAPFDGILVACAPEHTPPELIAQLKPGGRLVLPAGPANQPQTLLLVSKDPSGAIREEPICGVRFVPMLE